MQMIFNELSAKVPVATKEQGREVMEGFLNTYRDVKKIINNDQIIINSEYQYNVLAIDYNIMQWRNDKAVDVETKRQFLSLLNKSVTFDRDSFKDEYFDISDSEFLCNEENAIGCLIAYETGNFVISLLGHVRWAKSKIIGKYCSLNDELTLSNPKDVYVNNVSNSENISEIVRLYSEKYVFDTKRKIASGSDILKYNKEIFPNLVFCSNACRQLEREIDLCNIEQIVRKLLELQNYFSIIENRFDKNMLNNATPESPATLEKYEDDHKFRLPDGKEIIFSWHIRFTGTYAGRIFFLPDPRHKICYIGHIGKKINTVKYH